MKRILLIGATSLIGQALLKNSEYEFTHPDRRELDLTNPDSIEKFNYKHFDCLILVAGAGMRHGRNFEFENPEVTFKYIENTIRVNCIGTTMLLRKYLAENKKGHVVLIGSMGVTEPTSKNVVYVSSKTYQDRMIDLLSNIYTETMFIKINPQKVESRFDRSPYYLSGDTIAETVWTAIDKNMKRIDIVE